jgi:putative DNA primase/helicase
MTESNVTKIDEWRIGLQRNDKSLLKKTQYNVSRILHQHPDWAGLIALDEFKHVITKRSAVPTAARAHTTLATAGEWNDNDTTRALEWLTKEMQLDASREMVLAAVARSAEVNGFHPVRDYLMALRWDGKQRLPSMLHRFFGAPDNEYTSETGKRFLIAAVARALRPGCKVDTMLVLEGKQGAKKSSAMRALFGADWFSDTMPNLSRENEGALAIRGVWGQEMPELDALRGANVTAVKAFLSKQSDRAREPYARSYRDYLRQCVFVGTTNDNHYLTDRSGNRRYWPVECARIDTDAIAEWRDQLWAEARTRYEANERWWLDTDELETLAREQQRERETREPWFELITKWLEDPHVITANGRQNLYAAHGLTTAQILMGALNMRPADIGPAPTQRVGFILKKLQWKRRQVRIGTAREYRYFVTSPDPQESLVFDPDSGSGSAGQTFP